MLLKIKKKTQGLDKMAFLINAILELFQRGKRQWTQAILVIHGKICPSIKIISFTKLAN